MYFGFRCCLSRATTGFPYQFREQRAKNVFRMVSRSACRHHPFKGCSHFRHLFDLPFNSRMHGYMRQRTHGVTLKFDFVRSPFPQSQRTRVRCEYASSACVLALPAQTAARRGEVPHIADRHALTRLWPGTLFMKCAITRSSAIDSALYDSLIIRT